MLAQVAANWGYLGDALVRWQQVGEVAPLSRAYRLFRGLGLHHLYVGPARPLVAGVLTRKVPPPALRPLPTPSFPPRTVTPLRAHMRTRTLGRLGCEGWKIGSGFCAAPPTGNVNLGPDFGSRTCRQ